MDIIHDIEAGVGRTTGSYIEIPDRKEAIRYCIVNGDPGDIIVLAGKGHEDYQEIQGVKHPMDERVLIDEILKAIPSIAPIAPELVAADSLLREFIGGGKYEY